MRFFTRSPSRELWQGTPVVVRWGFVWDDNYGELGPLSGEVLLLADGSLLRRMEAYEIGLPPGSESFSPWEPVDWWGGENDRVTALRRLQGNGYDLREPGPTPIDATSSGPWPPRPRPRPVRRGRWWW